MTPQEAAEQYANILKSQFMIIDGSSEFSSSDGQNVSSNIKSNLERAMEYNHHAVSIVDAFTSGAKWQSKQDNQALSSALKEIAELHAKVKDLQEALNSVCTKVERSTTLMIYTEPDVEAEINKARKLLSI